MQITQAALTTCNPHDRNEWYIFVANPDYESCDIGQGDACGGITVAHLNFAGYGDLPRIVKVGEAEVSWETTRGGWIYIHDMTVQTWPGDDSNDPDMAEHTSMGHTGKPA
ncbi:MAG: hypothetical protein Ct9H90mP24_2090 [Methanobacteriota archaeon]|nr:MAG: hypothetical protein Ct9H90mP24_2090 [Euryarchaeota archaeon]